jgi:hypothetical protein
MKISKQHLVFFTSSILGACLYAEVSTQAMYRLTRVTRVQGNTILVFGNYQHVFPTLRAQFHQFQFP